MTAHKTDRNGLVGKTTDDLLDQLSLEEQVSILAGDGLWSVNPIERLGIGTLRVTDGPSGARGSGGLVGGVTAAAFPVGIAIGATWDPELAMEIGAAIAAEVKSKGAHVSLAPTVNIHRSVTNGRNFECYSEDPELTAALGVGYIKGLQDNGVAATVKHFVGNESEIERTTMSSEIDERSLREVYLRPFEDAVKKAGTWAVMSSYNRLNGTFTSEHDWLLHDVLRGDWGFDGVVMSDWFGSHSTAPTINAGLDLEMPGPTRDRGEKLLSAVEMGEVDRQMVRERAANVLKLMERAGSLKDRRPFEEHADDRPEHRALIRKAGAAGCVLLKNNGMLPLSPPKGKIAVIGPNAKVARIMGGGSAQMFPHYSISPWDGLAARLGEGALLYAPGCTNHRWEPLFHGEITAEFFDNQRFEGSPVHVERMEASEGFWVPPVAEGKVDQRRFSVRIRSAFVAEVDGIHRFGIHSAGYSKILVDGDLIADAHDGWTKGRTYFEEGCDEVVGEKVLEAGRSYEVVIEFVSKDMKLLYGGAFRAGIGVPMGDAGIAEAVRIAAEAETAIVFIGRSEQWDTEGSDLQDITLPGRQDDLVAAVLAVNPRTVVVLQTGGPVQMPWADDAPALLQAWYPGQEAGNAIADVLFGDTDPSGRLPQTFPRRWQDNPTWSQDREVYPGLDGKVRYEEGVFVGYRHYAAAEITPLFPFGHGLSYTQFDMSDLEASVDGTGVTVSFTLTNIGDREGSAVAQLYVGERRPKLPRPARELKGFSKRTLKPGESRQVHKRLTYRDFAYFDVAKRSWVVDPGRYVLSLGWSATGISAEVEIDLEAHSEPA